MRHNKIGVDRHYVKLIDPSDVFKLINLIDEVLLIPNIKLANSVIFFSSYCNALNWQMPAVNSVKVLESMSNSLNSMSLNHELTNELKM